MLAVDIKNINESSVKIKKPLTFDETYKVFNLSYDDNFFLLRVQNIHLAETNSKCYSYVSNNFLIMHKLFDTIINKISSHSMYKNYFDGKLNKNSTKSTRIKTATSRNEDIVVFDINGSEIDISRLFFADKLNIVFNVKHVWINRTSYGIYYVISQILRNEPIGIKQNLFFDTFAFTRDSRQDAINRDTCTISSNNVQLSLPPIPPPLPPPMPKRIQSRLNVIRPTQQELMEGIEKLKKIRC
jgi:hypothetical protein